MAAVSFLALSPDVVQADEKSEAIEISNYFSFSNSPNHRVSTVLKECKIHHVEIVDFECPRSKERDTFSFATIDLTSVRTVYHGIDMELDVYLFRNIGADGTSIEINAHGFLAGCGKVILDGPIGTQPFRLSAPESAKGPGMVRDYIQSYCADISWETIESNKQ